ncbi:sugar ABC transporter substrate-binding protein [Myxococcota bacterium]|nr:sugar ABC transporter substrate-binding protein [Myxococcota bacterium]MBU1430018.1 sugar ABC transporter substrate-binding protein [Myxococcota bacterium]MBU1899857.1 sugar ABC transporter substrate-binding protein [Myxococcota bacterium]
MILACLVALLNAPPLEVGVLRWSENIACQVMMFEGLKAAARGAEIHGRAVHVHAQVAGDEHSGIQKQITQMEAMIAAKVDLIIVQPTDNVALSAPLKRANAAGIPVIAYDQYISDGQLTAYVTSNNYQAGYLDGEYINARFKAGRALRLILVEYPHVSSTVERVNGFLAALEAHQRPYEVLARYKAVEPLSGRAAGAAILRDFPKPGSVDVVFTVNDGGGLSVVEALAEAGREEIAIATIDGDPRSVANIKAGRLTVIDAAQFCGMMGAEAMRLALRHLRGERVPRHSLIPTFPITQETLSRYPGWAAAPPPAFDYPWPSLTTRWRPTIEILKH